MMIAILGGDMFFVRGVVVVGDCEVDAGSVEAFVPFRELDVGVKLSA